VHIGELCGRFALLIWAVQYFSLDWHTNICGTEPAQNDDDSDDHGRETSCRGNTQLCRLEQCRIGWRLCYLAARAGNLPGLRWLRDQGCPWNHATTTAAAETGRLDVLQWATASGCPVSDNQATCAAARGGHLSVLMWGSLEGWKMDKTAAHATAQAGHLHVLRWLLRDEGAGRVMPDKSMCAAAARGGHLCTLQWLRQVGCPWDQSTCNAAARAGHIEILQWAIGHGCSLNPLSLLRYVPAEALVSDTQSA
jgi:hypothetical protein